MSYGGLLINTCNIKRKTFDKWGEPATEITIKNIKCRIMYWNRLVRDFKGEEVLSSAKLFFKRSQEIRHQDLIEYDAIDHAVLRIGKPQDSKMIHHQEVYVA